MRAKFINEIQGFERGGDPYRKLGVGRIYQIEKWFSDLGISLDEYTINKDFNINVYGDLYLGGTNITSLPDNLSVGGWLDLDGTDITSLPNDLNVKEEIWLDEDEESKVYIPEYLKNKVKY